MDKEQGVQWKEFRIGDLFDSVNGDTDIKKEHINGKGIDVVSSGVANNGIIGKTDIEAKIIQGNTITVDMFGNTFYRANEYKMVTHARVFALLPQNFVLSEPVGLFICTALKWLASTYSFSNMCSYKEIKDLIIYLPSRNDDTPDWDYMADRIKELEAERIKELEAYLLASGLDDYELTEADKQVLAEEVQWKEFRIGNLFNIEPTSAYKMTNLELFRSDGNVPVLSNSSANNGISGYCGLEPTEKGNIITFSDTTTGGNTMFFQEKPFVGYSHVQGMYPLGFELDERIALFLISSMRKAVGNMFDYANKFNRAIVREIKVLLPVGDNNQPDWDYMERYIRAIEKSVIADAVKWKDRQIAVTKQVADKSIA